jgi:thiol-disulfide isomerase/thioredoxin
MRIKASLMGMVVLCVAGVVAAAWGAEHPLAAMDEMKPIWGKAVGSASLRGKVVFFEYWGTQCPPCRASFPHLKAMQAKFGKSGKFQLIASHVQNITEGTATFVKQQRPNFPIYQQLNPESAPCGRGIPSAYLFDHEGKIIGQGHPARLYGLVAAAVAKAPGGAPTSVMLGDFWPEHCGTYVRLLQPGRAILGSMTALERVAESGGERAAEAKQIMELVNGWIARQIETAEKAADSEPSKALMILEELSRTVAGMAAEEKVRALLGPLEGDQDLVTLMRYRQQVERQMELLNDEKAAKFAKRRLAGMAEQLKALADREGVAEKVKAEAAALAAAAEQAAG